MKFSWGWKITILYAGFVVLILTLVYKSSHQHFDLVSKDYYKDEIAYQNVLDAGKNQSGLSSPVSIHADDKVIVFEFPAEFNAMSFTGNIMFYSVTNAALDKKFDIQVEKNTVSIQRSKLENTSYKVKINWQVDKKAYYQESEINLHS